MTKEKIKASVKTAYSKYGLKDAELDKIVNILEKNTSVMGATDETFDVVIKEQLDAYEPLVGMIQSAVDSRVKTTPPVPPVSPPAPEQQPQTLDARTLELLESIKKRQDELDAKEAEQLKAKQLKDRDDKVLEILQSDKTLKFDKKILNTTLALNKFDETLTAEVIAEKIIPIYNKEYAEFRPGAAPLTATPLSTESAKEAQAAAIASINKYAKEQGVPVPESK